MERDTRKPHGVEIVAHQRKDENMIPPRKKGKKPKNSLGERGKFMSVKFKIGEHRTTNPPSLALKKRKGSCLLVIGGALLKKTTFPEPQS